MEDFVVCIVTLLSRLTVLTYSHSFVPAPHFACKAHRHCWCRRLYCCRVRGSNHSSTGQIQTDLLSPQSFCLEASLSGPQERSSLVSLLTLALVSSQHLCFPCQHNPIHNQPLLDQYYWVSPLCMSLIVLETFYVQLFSSCSTQGCIKLTETATGADYGILSKVLNGYGQPIHNNGSLFLSIWLTLPKDTPIL